MLWYRYIVTYITIATIKSWHIIVSIIDGNEKEAGRRQRWLAAILSRQPDRVHNFAVEPLTTLQQFFPVKHLICIDLGLCVAEPPNAKPTIFKVSVENRKSHISISSLVNILYCHLGSVCVQWKL